VIKCRKKHHFFQITSYNGKAAYEKEGPDQLYIYFFTSQVRFDNNISTSIDFFKPEYT
jgi:hypothetical protein